MGFFQSLERKVFRPVGRGLKSAAPVLGGIAGSFIPGVGNVVGSALGSALGGQLKRGKFDGGALLKDAGMGVLTGGVMNKLGGGSFLGGAKVADPSSLVDETLALSQRPDMANLAQTAFSPTAAGGAASSAAAAATPSAARAGGGIGNWLRDGKNLKALGDTLTGAYGAVQQERMMRQRQREIEEDNRRRAALDPARAALLSAVFQRMGVNGGAR